ncbi:MAG: hypothetical protein Fur0037_10650 [Planctomycetota bacterium]
MMRFFIAPLAAAGLLCAQVPPAPSKPVPGDGSPSSVPGKDQAKDPSAWFQATSKDLGTFFNHEEATGQFEFKNPCDKPVEWRSMVPSCTCSRAVIRIGDRTYEMSGKPNAGALYRVTKTGEGDKRERINLIQVDPGESGFVEVHMDMHGVTGMKSASVDIHTTDPDHPLMQLKFSATGAQQFVVNPPEVNFGTMTWNESREFKVRVTSPLQKDFEIVRMDAPPSDFKVHYEKSMENGEAIWTISGTYGPLSSETGGGGVLRFFTNLPGMASFQVRVTAFVKGPLEIKPGTFLTLGLIRKGTSKSESVVFEPNDGSDLTAASVVFEKLTVPAEFVTAKTSKDGNKLVVTVEISSGCPSGLVRGDMVVNLNHPAIPQKRILFNGYVR